MVKVNINDEIIELDSDVVMPVKYLNENGVRTLFSCDGVSNHHKEIDYELVSGYISMEASNKSMLIINNAYKEGYGVSIGQVVTFYFKNHNSENTKKVMEIIRKSINEEIDNKEYNDDNNGSLKFIYDLYKYYNTIESYIIDKYALGINIKLNHTYKADLSLECKNKIEIRFIDENMANDFYSSISNEYKKINIRKYSVMVYFNGKEELLKIKELINKYFKIVK